MFVKKLIIGAGHGGADSGALNIPLGLKEKTVNLTVAKLVYDYFKNDLRVECVLLRDSDKTVSLSERVKFVNESRADAYCSIHFNSARPKRIPHSHEVYTSRGDTEADEIATQWVLEYEKLVPDSLRREDQSDGDPDKEINLKVLRETKIPAILVEPDFIHTEHGGKRISQQWYLEKVARSIVNAFLSHWFGAVPEVKELVSEPKETAVSELSQGDSLSARLRDILDEVEQKERKVQAHLEELKDVSQVLQQTQRELETKREQITETLKSL